MLATAVPGNGLQYDRLSQQQLSFVFICVFYIYRVRQKVIPCRILRIFKRG